MRAMVLLRHEMPGGESHFDWLIDPGAGRGLITFRLDQRIDLDQQIGVHRSGGFDARRLGDHRRRYLDYEGPISDGRGCVVRLARGFVSVLSEQTDRIALVGSLGSWSGVLVGCNGGRDIWRFEILA